MLSSFALYISFRAPAVTVRNQIAKWGFLFSCGGVDAALKNWARVAATEDAKTSGLNRYGN